MNFGILHLGHPQKAIHEAFRVLKPKGHFAFTAWCAPTLSQGFAVALEAIEAFGETQGLLPEGPPFFHFGAIRKHGREI